MDRKQGLWLLAILLLLGLHGMHLRADFPNYSPWVDWAKFTDEGWYGNAAIEHIVRGSWYVPGDFNPAVALPVWPLLESAVFHFTGLSLVAARALAVLIFSLGLWPLYCLTRRFASRWIALAVVTLLAASPFYYAFSRLAILEPLMILFSLLALALAAYPRPSTWRPIAIGVLLPLIVLTKTIGICVIPAIVFLSLLSWRSGIPNRIFVRQWMMALSITAILFGGYFFLLVKPHYLLDWNYLFSANVRPPMTLRQHVVSVAKTLLDGSWIDAVLYPLAGAVLIYALVAARRLFRNPLFAACCVWIATVFVFIAWHGNFQPRYYLPAGIAVVILIMLALDDAVLRNKRLVTGAMAALLVVAFLRDVHTTVKWALHPEYSYFSAAQQVNEIILHDPQQSHILMSISGNEIGLMTGLPTLCDDFGTDLLDDRIARYRPGWYAAWDDIDEDTEKQLREFYELRLVASIPAMDDPDRAVLNLYKLVPLAHPTYDPGHSEDK